MTVNPSGWKPSSPSAAHGNATSATTTGNRALMLEEPLIFEMGDTHSTGVDFETDCAPAKAGAEGDPTLRPSPEHRLAGLTRTAPIGLPGLSEPETVRHYTRLSRQNMRSTSGCSRSAAAR